MRRTVPDAVASRTGYIDPATVASGEETVQAIFFFEFVLSAWAERFRFSKYLRSPVALVDFAAVLPTLVGGCWAAAAPCGRSGSSGSCVCSAWRMT